jgi:arylamine N-acetyltransferase
MYERFLALLNIKPTPPSVVALNELITAFLSRVPFENVSKLYHKAGGGNAVLPDFKSYLDGIEAYNFGGTCYANNYYFNCLLKHLGYTVMLCGADMNNPDVHVVSIAIVDGREYLVDVGYAAPFLTALPRDLNHPFEILRGRDRYVLTPQDDRGRSRLELYRDDTLRHQYTVKPIDRPIEYFADVIADSYSDRSTFMNALLVVKHYPKRSIAVYNQTIIESDDTRHRSRELDGPEAIPDTIEQHFGIPANIVAIAINQLGDFGDAWT